MNKLLAVAGLLFLSLAAYGQTAPYYITNGDGSTVYVVQGGALQDTFTSFSLAYPIAVGSTVRIGHRDDGTGYEYELDGTATGTSFTGTSAFSQLLDGTTDGVQYNYGVECCGVTNSVMRADRFWENGTVLFNLPGNFGGAGIAYDGATDHLFISEIGSTTIREFDLAGTLINSFSTTASLLGLAWEASTDTLWGYTQNGTLYQYSKTGTLLNTIVLGSGFGNAYGGEMPVTVPNLYGVESGGEALYLIDSSDGAASTVGDPPLSLILGLAFNRVTQVMYATDGTNLYTINLDTAATTLVGAHAASVTGLTFDSTFTTLYALGYDDNLYSINPATGAATIVGPSGQNLGGDIVDLATTSSGAVYAAGIDGNLYTVNTATGAITNTGAITGLAGGSGVTAIAFDDADILYAIDTVTDALYTIDVATRVATLVGGDVGSDVRGLAFAIPAAVITASPELTATKESSGETSSGGTIIYTIVITNEGDATQPDNADDEFVDELPDGLQLLSAEASSGSVSTDFGTDTVRWNGAIDSGATVTITIEAAIQASEGTEITNQGTVYFDADLNGSNESSNVTDDPSAGGDDDGTGVVVGAAVSDIPALSPMALAALALMIAGAAFVALRLQG